MSAMPIGNLFLIGCVLVIITLLFVVLLVLPGKGRGWRIGLLCLLVLMGGAGSLMFISTRHRVAQQTQSELVQIRTTVKDAEQHQNEVLLLDEDGLVKFPTPAGTPQPPVSVDVSCPDTTPTAKTCRPNHAGRVSVSVAYKTPPDRRPISGVGSVLSILGVLVAAIVVLKIATRHNARPG